MIRVWVTVTGRLMKRAKTDREGEQMEMPLGARVRDLVTSIGLMEEEVKKVSVNGRHGRLDSSLRTRDNIELS
jgi:hypothetical protein